jgi:hypothetical protein
MKRIRINAGKVGLLFQNGDYKKMLAVGTYWVFPGETVQYYDMTKQFVPSIELNILLQDAALAEQLTVVDVQDHELLLQYENGNFKTVLGPGKYAYWKGVTNFSFTKADLNKIEVEEDISLNILLRKEVVPYIRGFNVDSYEQGILLIDGKFSRVLEPGAYFFWKNAIVVSVLKADLRQQQMEVSGQEILTRDKAALRINFFAQYRIMDAVRALTENKEYEKQLYILVQLALREFVGTMTLDELLEKKESVSAYVLAAMQEKAYALGTMIMDCGVRDIILPGEMKEIMNQVLIAQKKAEANVIMRREETASTRSLLNTAKLMEENTMLFKLKEMEYVEKIADKISTISLSGGNSLVDQLKDIFVPRK